MNSVPEHQREPDRRSVRYIALVLGRQWKTSDDGIAAQQGFGSPQALYAALEADGFPICRTCGELHVPKDHCAEGRPEKDRRAHLGGGEGEELPPAAEAAGLFREALQRYERDVQSLARRRERRVGKRFVVERDLVPGEVTLYRTDHSEEQWRELCQELGEDPARAEELDWPDRVAVPGDVSPDPPEPLARLVGMYALSGLPFDSLLAVLRLDPEGADREALEDHIEGKRRKQGRSPGLKGEARTVAKLARGGEVRTGTPPPGLDPREEEAAAWIRDRSGQDASEEEILAELRAGTGFSTRVLHGPEGEVEVPVHRWPDMTLDDLRRLKGY